MSTANLRAEESGDLWKNLLQSRSCGGLWRPEGGGVEKVLALAAPTSVLIWLQFYVEVKIDCILLRLFYPCVLPCHCMGMEVRGQLCGSLLPPGLQGLASGHQACRTRLLSCKSHLASHLAGPLRPLRWDSHLNPLFAISFCYL